jgi:hypothetical protein
MQAISNMLNVMERFYRGGCAFNIIAAHNGVKTLYLLGYGVMGATRCWSVSIRVTSTVVKRVSKFSRHAS